VVLRNAEALGDLFDRDQFAVTCGEVHQKAKRIIGLEVEAHFVAPKSSILYIAYMAAERNMEVSDICARTCRACGKEPAMYRLLMGPSNAVCDVMRITDEGERGMIRMLVNMMLLTAISVIGFVAMIGGV